MSRNPSIKDWIPLQIIRGYSLSDNMLVAFWLIHYRPRNLDYIDKRLRLIQRKYTQSILNSAIEFKKGTPKPLKKCPRHFCPLVIINIKIIFFNIMLIHSATLYSSHLFFILKNNAAVMPRQFCGDNFSWVLKSIVAGSMRFENRFDNKW